MHINVNIYPHMLKYVVSPENSCCNICPHVIALGVEVFENFWLDGTMSGPYSWMLLLPLQVCWGHYISSLICHVTIVRSVQSVKGGWDLIGTGLCWHPGLHILTFRAVKIKPHLYKPKSLGQHCHSILNWLSCALSRTNVV